MNKGVLFHADALQSLPVAQDELGPLDLIYVDPPYNAGGARGARSEKGTRAAGELAYKDSWGGLDGFLNMFEPRLMAMRDALSDRGSIWIHLDHRTVHDVKVLADRIFGRDSFVGDIIWVPGNGGRRKNAPPMTHQTILVFKRGREMIYNVQAPELREPHAETSLKMHFKSKDEAGRHFREKKVAGKTYRYYADEGKMRGSVWTDIPSMRANTPLNKETTGYPTQKPLELLDRIIAAATTDDSIVFDPMCGSGTTLAAAHQRGLRSGGSDKSATAIAVAEKRLGLKARLL